MFKGDSGRMAEAAQVGIGVRAADGLTWHCRTQIAKRWLTDDAFGRAGHVEHLDLDGNTVLNGGVATIWQRIITKNPSTSSTGAQLQAFSSGVAKIGLGASTATAAATQTDLQTTGTKTYITCTTGYPKLWNVTSSSGRMAQFAFALTSSQANYAINEWGVFNSTSANKRMLNRKVQALGTKTSAQTWTGTITLSIS